MIQYTVIIPQYNALLYIYFSPLESYAKVWFCCKLSATFGYSTEREREKEWEKKKDKLNTPSPTPTKFTLLGIIVWISKQIFFHSWGFYGFFFSNKTKVQGILVISLCFFFFNEESDNQLVYIMEIMHWTMLWDY